MASNRIHNNCINSILYFYGDIRDDSIQANTKIFNFNIEKKKKIVYLGKNVFGSQYKEAFCTEFNITCQMHFEAKKTARNLVCAYQMTRHF